MTAVTSPHSALITGTSSGIGKATAELLLERGYRVIAASRQLKAMQDLKAQGATVLALDISSDVSRKEVAAQVMSQAGVPDVLVNNAGFGEIGPLETMPLDQARAMFEVNVFGLMDFTRLFLPAMRRQRRGRIINISSIAGRFATPCAGWYGASKFALEGLSDALRLELHQFGVRVVLVEPGLIRTNFLAKATQSIQQAQCDSVYGPMMARVNSEWHEGYGSGSSAEIVAKTIEQAIIEINPKARYFCGHRSESLVAKRFLPTWIWDLLIRRQMT